MAKNEPLEKKRKCRYFYYWFNGILPSGLKILRDYLMFTDYAKKVFFMIYVAIIITAIILIEVFDKWGLKLRFRKPFQPSFRVKRYIYTQNLNSRHSGRFTTIYIIWVGADSSLKKNKKILIFYLQKSILKVII